MATWVAEILKDHVTLEVERSQEACRSFLGLGLRPANCHPEEFGSMTYNLRRLLLRGLIERLPGATRSPNTALRIALFYTRSQARILRP